MNPTPRVFALAMLNSSLEESAVAPFLDDLWNANYRGICLHPRDGLRVPYDSRAYWEKIDRIIELSKERGFAIWHYDEFPFPSGMGGGLLLEDFPGDCVRGLHFEEIAPELNSDGVIEIGRGTLLALLRYRIENGQKHDVRDVTADCGSRLDTWVWGEWHNRYYTGTLCIHEELHERGATDRFTRAYIPDEPLRADEKLLAVKVVTQTGRVGLPGKADVTRREVTDRFLETIYTRLSEISRKHDLGATPVFQDEVAFGVQWPWNEEIASRLNWNSMEKLAALHAPDVEGWENARCEFRGAATAAFEENWFKRVADWCGENGLAMTGHLPGEESIIGHCQHMGNAFKTLRHFDVPGYDIISSTIPDDLNRGQATGAKLVQSVAWSEGRKPTMVEVFGANGFHNDVQKNRSVLAWLAAHDLNHIFDHSAYQSGNSVRKYDAPPIHTSFNPLWAGRAELWNWYNWLADLLEDFRFVPRTLILFPVESLARYAAHEEDLWRDEATFLETWFHTALAASLDAVFVPAHRLDEVRIEGDGFQFCDQHFQDFLVPPVVSFQEETFEKLKDFANHPRFSWTTPISKSTPENGRTFTTVFGASGSREIEIPTTRFFPCDEKTLLHRGAAWFDEIVSPSGASCDELVLSTRRRNASGEELLLIMNPHEREIRVRCDGFGVALAQPPQEIVSADFADGSWKIAPRDVLVLRAGNAPAEKAAPRDIQAQSARVRLSTNYWSLQHGVARLDGEKETAFVPAPISSVWPLHGVAYASGEAVYAPDYSREKLPMPRHFEAQWSVPLHDDLTELTVILDADSLPPNARVFWNDTKLQAQAGAILDRENTIFPIPQEGLGAGNHFLRVDAVIDDARFGVLERPILNGAFVVKEGALHAMPQDWNDWNGETFSELGLPQGWNAQYKFEFELSQEQATKSWQLKLPPFIGVAEVKSNEIACGKTCWEPRLVPVKDLRAGENTVYVRLHGSWNNVFSTLNTLENGLRSEAMLQSVE